MNTNLREQLKELRLSGLWQSLEVRLQEARSSKLDYAEFLELILEDEMITRRDRQIDRRTKAAAFRDQKSLDDFDFDFNATVKRKQIDDHGDSETEDNGIVRAVSGFLEACEQGQSTRAVSCILHAAGDRGKVYSGFAAELHVVQAGLQVGSRRRRV